MAKSTALLFFIVLSFATVIRPIIADLSIIHTYLGIINSATLGILYGLFHFAKPRTAYVYGLMVLGIFHLLLITTVSGGINSHFAVLIASIPVFTCLLIHGKAAVISAAFIILYVLILGFFSDKLISIDAFDYNQEQLNAKTFWLCLGIIISTFFCVQFDNMTSRLSNELSLQANIDSLTGLYNRRKIMNILRETYTRALRKNQHVSLLMLDVDHFKKLNDTHGHLLGDQCLIQVANNIQQCVREATDFVGRFGGEEFLILLANVNPEQTKDIAEQIRKNISNSEIAVNDEVVKLTATIGYVSLPADQVDTIDNLINMADQALYTGKKQSRDCVVSAG